MNFLMLDDLSTYTLNSVERKRRHLLRRAAQHFQFRPITDPQELKNCGHRVYLSFYERTQYDYKSDRRDKTVFDRWVDSLFFNPKTIICGGYGPNGLSAIATGYWVNETLIHSTLMCDTESLRMNLVDFMFHEIRLMVAQEPRIRQIFVRTYQGGNSLDQYYLHRDCRLVKMPARLDMPTSIQFAIRQFMPHYYKLLCGND